MCSEPSSRSGDAAARCLLCNVGCPVRLARGGPDRWVPDYVPHAGYAGLCGRGSVLAELLDHADRILAPARPSDGADGAPDLQAACEEAAAALGAGRAAAIVVDGNADLDTIEAARRLAAARGARWSVFVPPADAGLVHGLDSSGCAFAGPEDLASADAVLIVGNAYATHPVAAHWIFESRKGRRRAPLLVIADASAVTADFATAVFQPRAGVGGAARAVAAIRTGDAGALGPEGRALAGWKALLAGGKSPAIVVGAELGYADALALGREVAALAKELKARVCPLTTYGNAWGAVRLAAAGGAVPVADVLADGPEVLLVIGTDLATALGSRAAAPALQKVRRLIWAGPMPSRLSRQASLVLPTAFTFEAPGRALLGPGREIRFDALLRPPAGVPTALEVLTRLGAGQASLGSAVAGQGAKADASRPASVSAAAAGGADDDYTPEGLLVAPAGDAIDFADGSLTRPASWPRSVRPRPLLTVAEADAEAAHLVDAGRAVVEGPGGSVEVAVATSSAQRPGQARLSAAFAEARDAFGWTLDGPLPGDPVRMRVRKA